MKKSNTSILVVTLLSALLSACGGGGGDSAGAGNSLNSNVTPTIDLKSAGGAKTVSAIMVTGLDGAQLSDYNSIVLLFPASATTSNSCSAGGTLVATYTNADGILSVGDSGKDEAKACATTDSATGDTYISNLIHTSSVTSVSGPTNDPKGVFTLGTNEVYSGTADTTTTVNGVKYRSVLSAINSTDAVQYSHDGKNTASTADDVFSKTSSQNVSVTGAFNGAPISVNSTLSTSCSRTGTADIVCAKHDQTFAGTLVAGTINASSKVTTPLRFNSAGVPVAGASTITQGSDTATVEYLLVGTVPSVKITSNGSAQTFSYAELSSFADTIF
jgi:hypothetical protein